MTLHYYFRGAPLQMGVVACGQKEGGPDDQITAKLSEITCPKCLGAPSVLGLMIMESNAKLTAAIDRLSEVLGAKLG